MDCIFCKIVNKEMKADVIYEDETAIALKDIEPKAPVHLLVVPRKHIASVNGLEPEDRELVGELVIIAKKLAREWGISETGYRLILNAGKDAGQTIDHLHLHVIGGEKLPFA